MEERGRPHRIGAIGRISVTILLNTCAPCKLGVGSFRRAGETRPRRRGDVEGATHGNRQGRSRTRTSRVPSMPRPRHGADRLDVRFVMGVRQGRGHRVLREPDPAGTGRALREVPFVGRRQAQGPVAARYARDDPARWILGPGGRAGGRGLQRPLFGHHRGRRILPDAPEGEAAPRRGRRLPPLDRDGRARSPRRLGLRGEGSDIGDPAALDWWSLRPLNRPAVPKIPAEMAGWCRTPIDRFVAARLAEKGLHPSAEADRRTLIRRLSFDLVGLPPSPQEVAAFIGDRSPDAYERLVDRLLDSPHYGERWARHWMDLVHFGETHGHDQDRIRPHAWPYRDYLIESFNHDTPYARFVQEQVAADALFPDEPRLVVALGMIAAGPWDESSLRDIRDDSIDRQIGYYIDRDDMVATVMSTFVSATVHCARCHDHKFDPISQADYYSLQAVFAGVDKAERPYDPDPAIAWQRRCLAAGVGKPQGKESGRAAWLAAELAALPPQALVFAAASEFAPDAGHKPPGGPRPVHLLRRGDIHQPGVGRPGRDPGLRPGTALAVRPAARLRRIRPASGPRPMADRPEEPADLEVDRQPGLALSLRPRAGDDAQRLRPDGRRALASRAARLAGRDVPRLGRFDQAAPPADRDQRGLPAGVEGRPVGRRGRRRRRPAVAAASPSPRCRIDPRRRPVRRGHPRDDDGGAFGPAVHAQAGGPRHTRGRLHRLRSRRAGFEPTERLSVPLPHAARPVLRRPGRGGRLAAHGGPQRVRPPRSRRWPC